MCSAIPQQLRDHGPRIGGTSGELVAALDEHEGRIGDVRSGLELLTQETDRAPFTDVEFTPDGTWLVATTPSGAIAWKAATSDVIPAIDKQAYATETVSGATSRLGAPRNNAIGSTELTLPPTGAT